ncbi:MAG: hypothetical protein DWB42_19555, partial [Chloroflexi bacterium]|nr:hypothetical protein [Chloroflexota bacterium]
LQVDGQPANTLTRAFAVTGALPGAPKLTTPANNALTTDDPVSLTWTLLDVTFTYHVQIATDSRFNNRVVDEDGLAVPSYSAGGLDDGLYFWRVRAVNTDTAPGPWSAVWRFTVDTLPPGAPVLTTPADGGQVNTPRPKLVWKAPVLTTPADGGQVNTPRPKLVWKAPTGGKTYTVQLKDDTDTIILTANTTATSLSLSASLLPDPLQHGRLYTWQVRAADAAGNPGSFSPPSTFTVNLLKAPAHDAAIRSSAPARVAFSWHAAGFTGAAYTLQVADNPAFSGAQSFPGLTGTSFTLPTDKALTPGRYYWRLQVDGQPANTLTRAFAVTGALPGAPKLTTPANNLPTPSPALSPSPALCPARPNSPPRPTTPSSRPRRRCPGRRPPVRLTITKSR